MKKIGLITVILTITMACNETKKETQNTTEEVVAEKIETPVSEWITLFDGTNFDQWKGYGIDEMHPEWTIENDAMVFTPGEEGGKNIITKDTFTNFALSLEWKISEAGNSGIFWGVHESKAFKEAYETGPEIQVLDDAKHPDSFVGEGRHKAGALYDMIRAPEGLVHPAGEWNLVELEVNHKTNLAQLKLNGKDALSFPVHGEQWDAMVANSKFKDWKGFGKFSTGHIGLQDHSDKVWFRNIKIKKIE